MEDASRSVRGSATAGDLLKELPSAAALVSFQGSVTAFNDEAAALFGWRAGAEPRLVTSSAVWFRRLILQVEQQGRGAAVITRRRDGRRVAVELRASLGGAGMLLVIFRDCSEQLNARRARALSERRLREFLDRLPDPLLIEQDGRIVYANDAAAGLMGDSDPAALLNRAVDSIVPAAALQRLMSTARSGAAAEGDPLEVTIARPGASSTVQIAAFPMQYRRRPALQLLLRDVTSQRLAEAGLRATHERLRLITDVVREYAILTLDADGAIVSWNSGAERLTGFTAEQAVRKPFAELPVGADVAAAFAAARDEGRHEFEATIRRFDGSEFRAHVTLTALQDPAGRTIAYALVLRDLTERLRAEESLRRSEEQLRHAQKMEAVGRLAAGIAHDFNNVLTAIQGHVQFLLEDLPAELPSRDDAVEIRRAADRATELTRQLLTFARRQPREPALLDLCALVRDLEKLLSRLIRADIRLETVLQSVPPVFADPGQMEQVIVNLVVNARDAMADGGVITVAVSPIQLDDAFTARGLHLQPGRYVQLSVGDTGAGMSPDVQRQVFEPFFTTKPDGTGLGLSTVYGIVQQSGGHISLYSELGVGTTFKLFLPVHGEAEPAEPAPGEITDADAVVLLVEDDDSLRLLARRTLEGAGFVVMAAADGDEAMRMAGVTPRIDIVVTDLVMPGVTGDDLARRIRMLHPAAAVVLMSGFSQDSLVREGRIEQHRYFLEKPFTPASLARTVRDALQRD